ncbi:hypothetical protein [Limnohabitans sp. MMS-10A-160]|jgi:hypothetical protein|uniref:hypothetical protein n=1 Tax=Limnohabitans sp. MMS-10A-160 TaxID=1835766 RepID=UPI001304BF04|nr:hypothetical protein [Limnohabitans sp. MMS-10A-160]
MDQAPTASVTHFFKKEFLAAPANFFSLAAPSQVAVASFSHLPRNEFLAAPANFFSVATEVQLAP